MVATVVTTPIVSDDLACVVYAVSKGIGAGGRGIVERCVGAAAIEEAAAAVISHDLPRVVDALGKGAPMANG